MATMFASPVNAHDSAFSTRTMGAVKLSTSGEFEYPVEIDSPKKLGFLGNILQRRNSVNSIKKDNPAPKQPARRNSIFSLSKKTPQAQPAIMEPVAESPRPDETTAMLIEQLELEGKTEEEINMHLSYIHDSNNVPPAPEPVFAAPRPMFSPPGGGPMLYRAPRPASPTKRNPVTQFFRDVKQTLLEEFALTEVVYYYDPVHPGLTINISNAPFYGAMPPEMDLSYEQLAALEPVYVGAKCTNSLPTCTHDGTPLPGDQTKCSVCLEEFAEGECLKSLPCVHFYHKDCIDSWLLVGHSCPVCKLLVD